MHDLNNFYTNGFCIIDDFLKDDLSKSLLSEFKTIKDWDRVDQVRNHYEKGGPFEMESVYFPNNDEEYYLQGWRAKDYESSKLWIKYFNDLDKIYQFGPYGPQHATAGTFAFKRELLSQTSYDDNAEIAEEKHFLKNYSVPLVQLDPMKAILVFAHQYNTFDKRRLLVNPHPNFVRETKLKPKLFIRDKEMREVYTTA